MSVINKMLRDLDRRAVSSETPGSGAHAPLPQVATGVHALPEPAPQRPARRVRRWPIALGLGVLSIGTVGWWQFGLDSAGRSTQLSPAVPPVASRVLAVAASDAAPALPIQPAGQAVTGPVAGGGDVSAFAATGSAMAPEPSRVVAGLQPTATSTAALPSAVVPAAAVSAAAATPAHSVATRAVGAASATAAPAAVPPTRLEAVAPPVPAVATEARMAVASWQDAALDVLTQALRAWNSGERAGALDMVREALGGIERTHGAELAGAGSPVVLALVRELVRMELAQGQMASVLATLKRYERVVAGLPDLWAVRGNAAQRLGLHAESAQAYQLALKLRPTEPRWMLGAAVSLAAMGQTGAATELAEQARAVSVVSPEVLAYLRQAGVVLRDR